ncbi:MAG: YhcN/YlaJ family sporulation lipoprotein [Peptococcaceae bacterium]|nr:YhcN/YlaJ family sporulation lipoprotein [Peptococcaceae bacterium]MDH7525416.1 YhcN/YlaJ family sporulation lipoprotein [Peptococcaceae bacterium]
MNRKNVAFIILALVMAAFIIFSSAACSKLRRPGPVTPAPSPAQPAPARDSEEMAKARTIADKISAMKEINTATVVLADNKAWVGVDLKAGVANKLTNAVKNEITRLVKAEDKSVDTVYVTADADMVTRLKEIARDIAAGKPVSGFLDELNEIGRRITPSTK